MTETANSGPSSPQSEPDDIRQKLQQERRFPRELQPSSFPNHEPPQRTTPESLCPPADFGSKPVKVGVYELQPSPTFKTDPDAG